MTLLLKSFLAPALALCVVCAWAPAALAQEWPNRPIKIIVPYPPGGAGDMVPRVIGQRLAKFLGQPVLVENRAGGDGLIGSDTIAKAAPDGYTIGVSTPGPVVIGKRLFPRIAYDPQKELVPVALTYETPFVLVVGGSSGLKTIGDVVTVAKSKPGALNAAIPSYGSLQHLLTEMMKSKMGLDIAIIPYKGGAAAATDVAGGQVEMTWGALPNVLALVRSGRLRALAVSSARRTPLLKDVPTLAESGWPTLVASNWNGLMAPAGTPDAILERLNRDVTRILGQPDVVEQLDKMGVSGLTGTRAEVAAFLASEEQKWAEVIRASNIKPE